MASTGFDSTRIANAAEFEAAVRDDSGSISGSPLGEIFSERYLDRCVASYAPVYNDMRTLTPDERAAAAVDRVPVLKLRTITHSGAVVGAQHVRSRFGRAQVPEVEWKTKHMGGSNVRVPFGHHLLAGREAQNVLLVEGATDWLTAVGLWQPWGNDEAHRAVCHRCQPWPRCEPLPFVPLGAQGASNLGNSVDEVLTVASATRRLVVVCDADEAGVKHATKAARTWVQGCGGAATVALPPAAGMDLSDMWLEAAESSLSTCHDDMRSVLRGLFVGGADGAARLVCIDGSRPAQWAVDMMMDIAQPTQTTHQQNRRLRKRKPSRPRPNRTREPMSQKEAIDAVKRLGSVGKMVGSQWEGSCPPPGCGGGDNRLRVMSDGGIFCRKCPDDGKAVWQAAQELNRSAA